VDVEAGVRPGGNALGPFGAQQLLADKHRQDLASEDLGDTRVVDPGDLMEDPRLVHPALRHEKMQVRVEIETVSERLDDGNDTGFDCFPRASLKIKEKRPDRTAAKIAQEPKMNYCLLAFYCLYLC
jgi:hypothetical protein